MTDEPKLKARRLTSLTSTRPSSSTSEEQPLQIDENLYSRQLYVLGRDAMQRMSKSDVLIVGLGGIGVEIAKNLILAGVKSITLMDSKETSYSDLSSQFYLSEESLGVNRAEASLEALATLNSYVSVKISKEKLSEKILLKYQVVVLTESLIEEQTRICDFAHSNNIAVIIASTFGLFGQIFCDFGENFTVLDTNGENLLTVKIANISQDIEGIVTTLDERGHGLEDGDMVRFSEVEGMVELNNALPHKIKVVGPYSFSIGNTSSFSAYQKGGLAIQVKTAKTLDFKIFSDSLKSPEFVTTDFAKLDRPKQLHVAFQALHEFHKRENCFPQAGILKDAEKFLQICNTLKMNVELDEKLIKKFVNACCGNLAPINSIIGGIAAQEAIKATTGKFHPIFQWLYIDGSECLPENWTPSEEILAPLQSRHDGQISVFGRAFQETLNKLRYFIVGAGAVGCEILKNFAMMGIGCTKAGGKIIITDMDLIETSNLNRQFLFRSCDLGQSKSVVAGKAIKAMNPELNVIAYQNHVGPETEELYDEDFFAQLDGVCNALDNVESRIYMDGRCVINAKPLFESGTMGAKGSTQVILPFLSESYASSKDPTEKWIPHCTLKLFPSSIDHTLQWARDTFDYLFYDSPKRVTEYLYDANYHEQMVILRGVSLQCDLHMLVLDRPRTIEDCVKWARYLWEEHFNNRIQQLLFYNPPDRISETGQPYWLPPKRCPHPLNFDINNPLHFDFVFATTNLKAQLHGIPQQRDRNVIKEMIQNVEVPLFTPRFDIILDEVPFMLQAKYNYNWVEVSSALASLPTREQLLNEEDIELQYFPFEKDDDANFHMDFITAASNLRASNYNIAPVDRLTSKLIAGKIIPAIVTTTSVVAGMVCLEIIKYAQGFRDLGVYKNNFVNLALPFFASSEPLPAKRKRHNEIEWTLWELFQVQGELTLAEFLRYFQENYQLLIKFIMKGHYTVYSTFEDPFELQRIMPLPMSQIVQRVAEAPLGPRVRSIIFRLVACDKNGTNIDLPYVRYMLPE